MLKVISVGEKITKAKIFLKVLRRGPFFLTNMRQAGFYFLFSKKTNEATYFYFMEN